MTLRYIAIDWGSTNLRAWLFDNKSCLDKRQSEAGITKLKGASPLAVLAEITAGWRDVNTPVIMAGMIGSNAGWKIAPYLPCPVALTAIGQQLMPVAEQVWIVPGLSIERENNINVMRGEETQLLGACHLAPSSLYVMPGTHCKWVTTDSSTILDFRTVMTGELHHILLQHSLVGVGLPEQQTNTDIFSAGLLRGIENPALLPQLFEVRAAHVLKALPAGFISEFLSGLLIGHEIAIMTKQIVSDTKQPITQPITIVGNPTLATRYQAAFNHLQLSTQQVEGDTAFLAGIRSIAHALAN
ncbi:2-dehydro-3-deoxygalactonokinase [Xenorhabdus sp. IM139775]|uniref:2-dehydro-3-deoxygalactonokinase n=1 Tax=Xenorhabdus sp. IM139775 TaxID=3025876 RepID=UPI00235A0610|nr:2-dehydro-3-deoxygalactonokinase [Xenorhabdus sp. IM139775]MDC9592104.1 2-dehydro-3-deoxygalactonokinase [Xenorhabdus sp. IM139775]